MKFIKNLSNFINRHAVSIMMVLTTAGFIIFFNRIDPIYSPHLFFILPLAFMIRGIHWEEMYWQQAVKQQAQIDYLETYTGKPAN